MAAPRVAVIGGGPCGSVAATMLRAMGLRVKLFDKGERLGGRASTRLSSAATGGASESSAQLSFDHGAQFVRAAHPSLKRLLLSPLAKDLFVPWTGRFGILGPRGGLLPIETVRSSLGGGGLIRDSRPRATSAEDGPAIYGDDGGEDEGEGEDDVDAVRALAELDFCTFLERDEQLLVSAAGAHPWEQLCARTDVDVAASTAVLDAVRSAEGWVVTSESCAPSAEPSEPQTETFDSLVLATHSGELPSRVLGGLLADRERHVPAEMEPFMPALTELVGKLQSHESEPVFTVLAAYPSATGVPFDAAVPHGCDKLRWICRDSSKPGREREDGMECWVAHCTRSAAQRYIADAPVAAGRPSRQVMENVAEEMAGTVRQKRVYLFCAAF
jgi:predicted NAD/FAD-dependent oxidoreductase